ncbi:MAG: L,D-transpeptidase family protein [Candidatus Deferrimicrobiaceae bacterium]
MVRRAMFLASVAVLFSYSLLTYSSAAEHRWEETIIGRQRIYLIKPDESLLEIARRNDIGIGAISAANPGVDPFVPNPGSLILLPTEWILPDAPIRNGIVINIAEMRLFVFSNDRPQTVTTFPIGIGDEGKATPVGTFTVIEKIKNPTWYVPESIRMERPDLPAVVPPGPDNPLGSHALRLSKPTLLIHGTNRPWGIGERVSHGCIRLYQEDIAQLFGMVRRGTRVSIVDQPVKAAAEGDRIYLQVHDNENGRDLYREALEVLKAKNLASRVDLEKTQNACRERTGLLVDVSR